MERDIEPFVNVDDTARAGSLQRRDLLIGGGLLAAAGVAYARMPRDSRLLIGTGKLEDLVPKTIGRWQFQTTSGLVLPPSDQLQDRIYSQLLTRAYSAPDGSTVMLLIAYSGAQDGVIQVHRPEICYPASGYRLMQNRGHDLQLAEGIDIGTRFIVAERDLRREQLMYWTRLGSYFPVAWADQRMAVIRENLAGIIPDGVLVRFSSVGDADAGAMLDAFATELYRSVGPVMKQVLAGTVGSIVRRPA
jgi:EpsI family protein